MSLANRGDKFPIRVLENVFVTEGVPEETFVEPPNFNEILVDVRHKGKPVIVEGSSGTGKTCTIKKILEKLGKQNEWMYLTARKAEDIALIAELAETPSRGVFIIDDFHRLLPAYQNKLSDIAKTAAEESDENRYPKLVLIGINQVGAALVRFSPDIAKRCGIHRITAATEEQTITLINKGCDALNIEILEPKEIYKESKGDYWLTQTLCRTACSLDSVLETQKARKVIRLDFKRLRETIIKKLETAYYEAVKDFCRGKRFRRSNDPYFRILQFISTKSDRSDVDLIELANANREIAGSINNIKDERLNKLLNDKPKAAQYFFYDKVTAHFSIEDPAVFYFLKHLDWNKLRQDCGFPSLDSISSDMKYEIAISYASENKEFVSYISNRLTDLDVTVFFDKDYESKLLGARLGTQFSTIFSSNSRFVLCVLDKYHHDKIWPTFERDIFIPRVQNGEVIPIYLDETPFPGIPKDLYGFKLSIDTTNDNWKKYVDDNIVLKLLDKIG